MSVDKVTKADIVDKIYNNQPNDLQKKEIQVVVDLFLSSLKGYILDKKKIELRGFGTFETKIRKGRSKAHNPKTGESLSNPVPNHGVVNFKPGQDIKKGVWDLGDGTK